MCHDEVRSSAQGLPLIFGKFTDNTAALIQTLKSSKSPTNVVAKHQGLSVLTSEWQLPAGLQTFFDSPIFVLQTHISRPDSDIEILDGPPPSFGGGTAQVTRDERLDPVNQPEPQVVLVLVGLIG